MAIAKFQKVVSLFKTTLAQRITDSATSVTLSDAPGGVMQYPAWMVVEPLGENVEIIYLPSAPSSTTYSSVVRGLDPESDNDTNAGFEHDHPAGVDVIISPIHRNWNELVKVMDGDAGTGATTLRVGDETDSNITIYAQNADGSKPYFQYNATSNKWLISNDGTSTYDISSGGSGLTRGLGVDISASAITLDIRSSGGLRNNQGTGSQQCDVDPTIVGRLDTANTWAAVQSFTANNCQITTDPDSVNDAVRMGAIIIKPYAGDGSDGDVTISSPTTLTRDMFYNTLTLTGANDITTAGYRIYVKGALTRSAASTAKIKNNGGNGGNASGGTGGTAGTAAPGVTVPSGVAGKAGADGPTGTSNTAGTAGTAGTSVTFTLTSSNGVAGGAGGSGNTNIYPACDGGAAGGGGTATESKSKPRSILITNFTEMASNAISVQRPNAGSGSGGSGGIQSLGPSATGGAGGGSGGSGGVVYVAAGSIVDSGSGTMFEAIGGNGGNGGNGSAGTGVAGAGGGGGGGGGNGGIIVRIYTSLTGTAATSVAGGTGGTGGSKDTTGSGALDENGSDGSSGASGAVFDITN